MTDISLLTGGLAPFDWAPNEETAHRWTITIVTGTGQWNLPQYSGIDVTMTHDGVEAAIEIPATVPEIAYIRDLVTDLIYARDKVPLFRLRVVDSEDVLARDGAVVRFNCVSYEYLLKRRIFRVDRIIGDNDINGAWSMIAYTQAIETLGITRGTMTAGTYHQRTFSAGDDIASAIDDWATSETGFDWWIDADLVWWAATPRRGADTGEDWQYGTEIAELSRESPIEDYASTVMTTGAQNETRIPTGTGSELVYPPPAPQLVQSPTKPYGLWERTVAYSDVVTEASLLEKANWELQDKGNIRPTYKLVLEPGIWKPSIGLGDIFLMRINAPPRANIKVPVRIEEIKLACSSDGGEQVTMAVRAEEPETFLTPSPIGPFPTIAIAAPRGRTVQTARLSGVDDMSLALRNLSSRLQAVERPPGTQSPAGYWNSAWGEVARFNGAIGIVGPAVAATQVVVMAVTTRTDRRYRATFQARAIEAVGGPLVSGIFRLRRGGADIDAQNDAYVLAGPAGSAQYGGGTVQWEFQGFGDTSNLSVVVSSAGGGVVIHGQQGSSTKFVVDDIGPVSPGLIASEVTPTQPSDTNWANVTYANGAVDYGVGDRPVMYRRRGDEVSFRGVMTMAGVAAPRSGKTLIQMPVGFRIPLGYSNQTFPVNMDNVSAIITVQSNGAILFGSGYEPSAYVFMDGVRYSTTA